MQLDAISLNERQALRESRLNGDAVLHHFAAGQGHDLKDCFVDLQAFLLWGRLLDEGADPADDVAGSMTVLDDTIESVLGLLHIGRLARQPAQAGIGVGDHPGERLLDFMGNRRRQLPHRGDAVDVRKLHLRLAQGFGGSHVLGEVALDHERGFDFLRSRSQR